MLKRFVILGMNNPQGNESFDLTIPGSSGERLYKLAAARTGISPEEWLERTHRINLCGDAAWNLDEAMKTAAPLREELKGITTLMCGAEVCRAMWFAEPPLHWDRRGRPWVMIPHTSGLNVWYNSPAFSSAVECLLEDLLLMTDYQKAA